MTLTHTGSMALVELPPHYDIADFEERDAIKLDAQIEREKRAREIVSILAPGCIDCDFMQARAEFYVDALGGDAPLEIFRSHITPREFCVLGHDALLGCNMGDGGIKPVSGYTNLNGQNENPGKNISFSVGEYPLTGTG